MQRFSLILLRAALNRPRLEYDRDIRSEHKITLIMRAFFESHKTERSLLLSRLLTRSGDQAWDFAIPISLLILFPDQLQLAAIYYFLVRLGHVLLTPIAATLIDHHERPLIAKWGILSQAIAVVVELGTMWMLMVAAKGHFQWTSETSAWFAVMTFAGLSSSMGATIMNIAVANDIVPAAVSKDRLAIFNSHLRQVDLLTEVLSPIVAGLLLLLSSKETPLLGLFAIVIWNVLSFVPEYGILMSVFKDRPELVKKVSIPVQATESIFLKLADGWRSFFKEPVAPVVACYALLWLSVLSPHGVLLTAFLKGGWNMPELTIGVFRGLGALFGISATFLFPRILKDGNLLQTSRNFLLFQALMVALALICFFQGDRVGQYGFLVCILFSRIGLYGFSLGEEQIRQIWIPEGVRGRVNGFASALTGIATLVLYGAGAKFSTPQEYSILVVGSVVCIGMGAVCFSIWTSSHQLK